MLIKKQHFAPHVHHVDISQKLACHVKMLLNSQ